MWQTEQLSRISVKHSIHSFSLSLIKCGDYLQRTGNEYRYKVGSIEGNKQWHCIILLVGYEMEDLRSYWPLFTVMCIPHYGLKDA